MATKKTATSSGTAAKTTKLSTDQRLELIKAAAKRWAEKKKSWTPAQKEMAQAARNRWAERKGTQTPVQQECVSEAAADALLEIAAGKEKTSRRSPKR